MWHKIKPIDAWTKRLKYYRQCREMWNSRISNRVLLKCVSKGLGFLRTIKAHLHYIRDPGPSIRVRAQTQSKQLNWYFVFTLVRVRVRGDRLGRPCPSPSLRVAISSDSDVRVRPRLCNAHAHNCSPALKVKNVRGLGRSVNRILSGARTGTRTRMLRQCKCKCALSQH